MEGPAPKKVLVAEPLSETGLGVLARAGIAADVRTGLSRADLLAAVADADALVVRSATQVDRELLGAGKRLKVVGRAGVGLDNVDVRAATELGILVGNAPSGMECTPERTIIFFENRDVPGVVGRIGTFLGSLGVNIAEFSLSRASHGRAAAVIRIDRPEGSPPEPGVIEALGKLEGVEAVRVVALS